jgi:DNA-binding NtrC family response regulator
MELLKRAKKVHPDMPVILITGFGSHETFKQAEELGAFKCLTKPFEPESLLKTIEDALKTKN